MNLTAFFSHPLISTLRYGQLLVAMCLYSYFALSGLQLSYSDSAMHFLGNICIFMSFWLAACLRLRLNIQFIVVFPFAGLIEVAQLFSPSRQFDINDMLFNFLGLGVGFIICFFVQYIFLNKNSHTNRTPHN